MEQATTRRRSRPRPRIRRVPEPGALDAALAERRALRRLPPPRSRRLIRQRAGLRQIDLARELGVSRIAVLRWEAGDRRPKGATSDRYAAILDRLITEGLRFA